MPVSYQYDKKRFEAFIDAIIAILLTILVLEIRVPEDKTESASTFHQVISLLPFMISYFASFMLIVGFWIDYHLLFVNIARISKRFIILNMLFILSLSFAPFVTAFAGRHYHDAFAVALLGGTYFVMNLFFSFIYAFARTNHLTDPVFWVDNKSTAIFSIMGIIAILAAIPLAFVNTNISFGIFLVVFGVHLMKRR